MNTILFDLDGTLLEVDKETFVRTYFKSVSSYFSDLTTPEYLMSVFMKGTEKMVMDNSGKTNKDVFIENMDDMLEDTDKFVERFDDYYLKEFVKLDYLLQPKEWMQKSIGLLKEKGYRLVIATNPMFPDLAVRQRIKWTGLDVEDFNYYPTYDNHCFTKPHANFYEEIAEKLDVNPSDCLMVGNDRRDDMVASKVGMKTYFLTDQAANYDVNHEITYEGDSKAFYDFVSNLPKIS
ncbi:HAD family hydrolase [Acidaminobacter sp. JC074]|uniref:HAD family hydrolase n=1 Tax=Acidaminobacter sp. JC074 TaxID=2530199 RepID=UPI001F10C7F7|nr:HAD-IA family hydrolase [Acidaminobacter sp. JC074]MCH4890104.1 HAD family hydrolase [Acidaminobacter sp. JC074]